jgi:enoyl-CoA hydratase/carnithine racemase
LPPAFGTAGRLVTRFGRDRALKLLNDATALTPTAALAAGLLDELHPAGEVVQRASHWVVLAAHQRAQRPAQAAIERSLVDADRDVGPQEFCRIAAGPVVRAWCERWA